MIIFKEIMKRISYSQNLKNKTNKANNNKMKWDPLEIKNNYYLFQMISYLTKIYNIIVYIKMMIYSMSFKINKIDI